MRHASDVGIGHNQSCPESTLEGRRNVSVSRLTGLSANTAAPAQPAADNARRTELSVIVPAFNEEESVGILHRRLVESLDPLGLPYEIIVVDDGSEDETYVRLAEIAAADRRVRVIKLRRNYGQTPAMVAGIDHAEGRILVTMDADMQNDPADIGALLAKLDEGYDMVVGWRINRQDKWLSRKLPSMIANRLIAWVTGVRIRDNGCTLKAFRADLIKRVPLYSEMHRFIPAMSSTLGCSVAEIGVRHHARPERLEGYDMVVGWRINRKDKWLSRKLPSMIANRLIAWVTGVRIRDNGCTLKAFRADLIKRVPLYSEMHRFIPAMSSTLGCSVAEIGVRHHARRHGTSKYGLGRIYRVMFDLVVIKALLSFARRPTAYLTGTAAVAGLLSLIGLLAALYVVLTVQDPSTVVFMSISVLLGSLALFLGLISFIAATIYHANRETTQARIGEWSGW